MEIKQPSDKRYWIVAAEVSSSFYSDRRKGKPWVYLAQGHWGLSHSMMVEGAMKFAEKPSLEKCATWSGMPWMDKHTGNYRFFYVVERVFVKEEA